MRLPSRFNENDPMIERTRQPHYVEIYFRGRRLEDAFVTQVARGDWHDLELLAAEAMRANEHDQAQEVSRYSIRLFEYYETNRRGVKVPRQGRRLLTYIPRSQERRVPGGGYAA